MKLSELLTKPLKLKGGGILNLKGFSKAIVDEEVGEGENSQNIFSNILNLITRTEINPHPTKVVDSSNYEVIDISDIEDDKAYYLLYKKDDILNLQPEFISYKLVLSQSLFFEVRDINSFSMSNDYTIDNEIYIYLYIKNA